VDGIINTPTNPRTDRPLEAVVIESVVVERR
jgi:peptidyl-prolyl cis-trans isomerase A (cyclophilin A)